MQNTLNKMIARMFADKKRQKRIVAIICVLSVLVTTTVFTELMQPVITMTPDPVCGLAEHAHSSDCFADQLACGVEESEEHAHGDGCYKSVLVCGKSEHAHTEKCYPDKVEEQKVTVIEPTEAPATEAPAVMSVSEEEPTEAPATEAPATEAPAEPEAMSETEPTAEVTAEPAAEVTAEPAAEVTAEPAAEVTAEPAAEVTAEPTVEVTAEPTVEVTAEPTVEVTAEPTVEVTAEPTAVPAPAVAVTAVSAEKVFVGQTVTWTVEASGEAELTYYIADESGAEIVSGALDVDASYISWLADRAGAFTLTVTAANETGSASANGSVTVEASEALVAAALADQLYCFAGEEITFRFAYSGGVEPASVSIAVYQDGQVLTELTEFAETVAVTPANLGEKVTTVTAEITVTDSLGSTVTGVCEIPCAVRTRETESDWEKSTRVDLTGEWPEDLIAVAETQLGYKESEINFIVNDEGERQGYTRYGQWYGSSYAEWCAMFVSFDLNYAEIPEKYFPREANCEKWISALKSRGLYESAEGDYEPQVGDLVFFDWEDNGESDHVGIITAVTDKKIETIEGNADKGVRRRDYDRDDEVLYGYGCVLEAYEKYLRDELDLDLEAGVGAQAIVTAETANLRAEADADSELVAQLAIDTVVDVLAAEQNRAEIWYQVAAGELTGYIRSDLVETDYIAVEALVPVVADYDSLMNRIAELPFDGSEAHALTAAGIADEAAFAYESGFLTDEQYAEIIDALSEEVMTADEQIMTLMEDPDGDYTIQSIVRKATYNNNAYSTATITFQPVDSEGNALNEVYRPSNFRYTFVRSTWNSSNFRDTCADVADFQNALDGGSIYDVKINVNGTEADAEYITILNTGYIQYGDSKNPSTKLTTTNAYFVVYYVPASFNVTYTDGSGSELLTDSAYNRECYAIPAVPGYELNTYVEGKGYMCGWQDASGNTYLYKVDMVEGDITLEPYWSADPIASYTVTFDVNGSQTQQTVLIGRTFGDLVAPDAAREGYRFDGWFTEADGGEQYTASTVVTAGVTLYAHYTEYIDVSFVINDSNYTNDPGSGYTHVTVNSIEGLNADGFTYTLVGTGDRYRVSGTGTLATFTIPAGESLSMNDLSTVAINVENQVENGGTSNNTYTYVSTYSWLDGSNKVCNANTIFNADTTLVLRLYQNNETYSLNFVCCKACGNSITFALSEAGVATTNPSFAVGESVDAAYFPADSDVNAYFSCNTCSACGRKTGEGETSMVLDYWYIIDENTPFTPGTAIGDAHVQLATGNSIPVYAAWKEAPNNVTVKFQNPDYSVISSSSEVTCYSEFGNIKPADPTLDGCTFVGWTTDGGATLVADDYIVSADVTFTAVYDATISVQMPDLANGDLTTYTTVNTLTVRTGENLPADQISAPIVSNGYIRSSWMVETTGGSSVYTDLSGFGAVTKAATVKAQYEKGYTLTFQYHTEEMAEGEYAVAATYYVKAGGTMYDAIDENGVKYSSLPTVSVPGYTFNNWLDSDGNSFYSPSYYTTYSDDTVYTASLTALPAHTVTFQYLTEGDGISEMTTAATYKTTTEAALRDIIAAAEGIEAADAQMPVCPQTLPTKYFSHWATADGVAATLDTVITADTTFEAVFADKVHVKFQYGYYDEETGVEIINQLGETYYVIPGEPLSTAMTELPVVELPGMRFGGWIEMFDDGTQTKVELDTVVTVDEGETEVVYSARLDTEISINFVYQDIMDSDVDGDTEEVITHAVYTMLPDNALSTAILMNADGTATEQTLSAIPVPPTFENYRFTGWYYSDGEQLASLEDVAYIDTNFTGIYEYHPGYTVTFHDIDPDGNERLPVGVDSLTVKVPDGQSVANYLRGVEMVERSAAEVIKWRVKDAEGAMVEYDPTQPVTGDLDLYTYTYRIVLTLAEETTEEEVASLLDILMPRAYAAKVEVSSDGDTLTIEIAAGEVLKASDLIKENDDGTYIDYSMYTYTSNSTTYTLSNLIGQSFTSNESFEISAPATSATSKQTVNFYVFVDDGHKMIASRTVTTYRYNDRSYITGTLLESVYGDFGFEASDLTANSREFPHVDAGGSNIWSDTGNHRVNSGNGYVYYSPIVKGEKAAADVYYLPGNTEPLSNTPFMGKRDEYMFYSIRVEDPAGSIYEDAEEIPAVAYVRKNGTATITVKAGEWNVNAGNAEVTSSNNDDGTVTYTIANVTSSVRLTPKLGEGQYFITYDVNISGAPTSTVPTVEGQAEWHELVELADDGTYIVKTPNPLVYSTTGTNSLVNNKFLGWAVNGNTDEESLLAAGGVLTKTEVEEFADSTHGISLTGQWQSEGNEGSVSFYVNLELQVADYSGSTQSTPDSNYTGAVYGTGLTIVKLPGYYQNANVIEGSSSSATAATDALIRQLKTGVTGTYAGAERTFTLDSFPDDERVLAQVRKQQAEYIAAFEASQYYNADDPTNVTAYRAVMTTDGNRQVPAYRIISEEVNGQKYYIPAEEITSANYTVRWYVFKYDGTNGWHVDGVLVKREGQLAITKTFYGYAASVADVKKNYSISVKNSAGSTIYTLNLNEKSDSNPNGYVAYDRASDTYTWAISLTQGGNYTLVENNYTASQVQLADDETGNTVTVPIASLAEYMVTSLTAGETVRRQAYPSSGVQVVARAYETDLSYTNYKTVKFYNSYIPTNSMLLSKVDDHGEPLANAKFQLKKDDAVNGIWKDQNGYYYIFNPNNTEGIEAVQTPNNLITTDEQGFATIIGLKDVQYGGNYELIEVEAPSGYTPIAEGVRFTVDGTTGAITLDEHPYAELLNGMNIKVTNTSETMSVTVNKTWTDGTNKEVTVALCLDGTPMAAYTKVLNEKNGWSHTWEDVPAYVGGVQAEYMIREMWIGDSAYSGTIDDGYDDYIVTYANPVYTYDDNGKPSTLTLNVFNRTYTGGVEFTKVDQDGQPLPGATFAVYTLYTDDQCQNQYGSSQQSGEDGRVDFGALAAGTYYMKETAAPDGYITDTAVYKVVVSGTGTMITRIDDATNTSVATINNYPSSADIVIRKVDGNGRSLAGATFQIDEITETGSRPYNTFSASYRRIEDVPAGTYTITETVAPAGYYGMTDTISFTITDGVVAVTAAEGVTVVPTTGNAEGDGWTYDASTSTFTVTNTPGVELPSTGGAGTLPYTMGGLLLMAASLLYGFGQRRKGERGDAI